MTAARAHALERPEEGRYWRPIGDRVALGIGLVHGGTIALSSSPVRSFRPTSVLVVVLALAAAVSAQRSRPAGPCDGRLDRLFPDPQLATLSQPVSAAVADLDGDGTVDVVVGHLQAQRVSVFRGLGGARFAEREDVASTRCFDLVVLDTDEDGDLDLALTDFSNDRISLLLNQGGGTFLAGGNLAVGDSPGALIAVDLGLDGRPELLSADGGSDQISVLVNLVGGAFSSAVPFAVAGFPTSLAALDQDHDGRADVAVTCFGDEKLQFLRNLGNTFAAPLELPSFPSPIGVIAADLDGDTFAELATTSNETSPFTGNALSVHPNQHPAGFGAPLHTFTPRSNRDLAAIDHDGDGDLDLAVATSGDPTNPGFEGAHPSVVLYANNGSGGLSLGPRRTVSTPPGEVVAGDLDGNGRSDLVVVNTDAATLSVLLDGGNDLAGPPRFATPYASRSLDAADLDGDGDRDLAVAKSFVGGAEAAVLLNQGQGSFGPYASYPMSAWEIECADVDGDDDMDLVVGHDAALELLLNQGTGTFTGGASLATGGTVQSVVASDLDGDGDLDLAAASHSAASVSVLRNLGAGAFAPEVAFASGSSPWCVVSGDLDGDGDLDLAVTSQGTNALRWLRNDGTASFPDGATVAGLTGPGNLVCVDLDRDADLDLAVASVSAGQVYLLENQGTGLSSFGGATTVLLGGSAAGSDIVASDLDRDGLPELVLPLPIRNSVLLLGGNGTFAPTFRTRHGVRLAPSEVVARDLDGDGDADLLTLDYWSASVTLLENGCR